MKELYESSSTMRDIAGQFGFSKESVRRSLINSGVEIVDRGSGRPRKMPPKKTLSDEELARLRAIVGFDPNTIERGIRVRLRSKNEDSVRR